MLTPRPAPSFVESVKDTLTNHYADYRGRARRSEYWYFVLFAVLVLVPGYIIMAVGGAMDSSILAVIGGALYFLPALGLLIPNFCVSIRRLHDTGRSGWWLLIGIVPIIGSIALLYFYCSDGEPHVNKWGANPKYADQGDPLTHFGDERQAAY